MKSHHKQSHGFLWPLAVLFLLTVGVFFTTKEVPNQQNIRSRAQFDQSSYSGAVISLSFSVPGISTQAGNLQPLHPVRTVSLRLYGPDSNSLDKTVDPLFIFKAQAVFDKDSTSPTYAMFIMSGFDLGKTCYQSSQCVPIGNYQIAFKTDQATQTLIKEKQSDIGGKIFTLATDTKLTLPPQMVTTGDIVPLPEGDNLIDTSDYDALFACFGEKFTSASCAVKEAADLDDNGVIDGVDYTILSKNLKFSPQSGSISPTVIPTSTSPASPTPSAPVSQPAGVNKNIFSLLILIFIFFVLLGGAFFFLAKAKNRPFANKEYYIKKQSGQAGDFWLELTDDNGKELGHYIGKEVKEGFAHIKGKRKIENGKAFIAVSEIIWEKKD